MPAGQNTAMPSARHHWCRAAGIPYRALSNHHHTVNSRPGPSHPSMSWQAERPYGLLSCAGLLTPDS